MGAPHCTVIALLGASGRDVGLSPALIWGKRCATTHHCREDFVYRRGAAHGQARASHVAPGARRLGNRVRPDGSAESVEIPASPASLTSKAHLATTLGRGDVTLDTVEHLLAAAYGLGVDNLRVEVDGPEIPGMDGSAASFVFLIRAAGIYEQSAPRNVLRVARPIEIREGQRRIRIEPGRGFRISYEIDFEHPSIGRQALRDLDLTEETSSVRSRAHAPSGSSAKSTRSGGRVGRAARAWTTPSCSTRRAC